MWNVRENETLGITHPFFRDGRARGEAIVCDEVTGCGHSLWGWDFYRETRVLYGTVRIRFPNGTATEFPAPAPESLIWRPDRITATYLVAGMTIRVRQLNMLTSLLGIASNLTQSINTTYQVSLNVLRFYARARARVFDVHVNCDCDAGDEVFHARRCLRFNYSAA